MGFLGVKRGLSSVGEGVCQVKCEGVGCWLSSNIEAQNSKQILIF